MTEKPYEEHTPQYHMVHEARALYRAEPGPAGWMALGKSKLSSKNQLTLPAAMTRTLDWRPGDELSLMVHGDMVLLSRLPRDPGEWLATTAGAGANVEDWSTDEKIDAWTRALREEWDEEPDWETDSERS